MSISFLSLPKKLQSKKVANIIFANRESCNTSYIGFLIVNSISGFVKAGTFTRAEAQTLRAVYHFLINNKVESITL